MLCTKLHSFGCLILTFTILWFILWFLSNFAFCRRYKLNITLQKLKINISDGRIISLINFIQSLPRPKSHTVFDNSDTSIFLNNVSVHVFPLKCSIPNKSRIRLTIPLIQFQNQTDGNFLRNIQHAIACTILRKQSKKICDIAEELRASFSMAER